MPRPIGSSRARLTAAALAALLALGAVGCEQPADVEVDEQQDDGEEEGGDGGSY